MTSPKEVGQEWTTYEMADGSLVCGEYAFVTELEFFDDNPEPTELVKAVWVLRSVEPYVVLPPGWEEFQADLAAERAEEEHDDAQ